MAAETLADGADNDLLSAYPARAHAIVWSSLSFYIQQVLPCALPLFAAWQRLA